MTDIEIEKYIEECFEDNYQYLKDNGGHELSNSARISALEQVKYYWKKNRELIKHITQTEVKLSLPEQKTPNKGIRYTIEGVVDIVSENNQVCIYDLKTHDPESVRANKEHYREQLYVYAYIWKTLRGNRMDNTAIIATPLARPLAKAIKELEYAKTSQEIQRRKQKVDDEFEKWEPIIPIGYSEEEVAGMIEKFGEVVEQIEAGDFQAPSAERLKEKDPVSGKMLGTHMCSNCDARFSCGEFRNFISQTRRVPPSNVFAFMAPEDDDAADFVDGNIAI